MKNGKDKSTFIKKDVAYSDDICRIIKVCAQSGVQEIKFGDLHLIFGEIDKTPTNNLRSVKTKPREQESQKISEEAQEKERLDNVAEYLSDLQLTDPLAYEKLLSGDLDVGSTT